MKAIELYYELEEIGVYGYKQSVRSKVDETKYLSEMLEYWKRELKLYPDKVVGSIMRYNILKDFEYALGNNDDTVRPLRKLSTSKS